jgi:serine/threonine protein kinase
LGKGSHAVLSILRVSGQVTTWLQDLHALLLPKEAAWSPGQAWLLDIYDWDLVLVEQDAALSFGLRLCVGLFPCSMWIKGRPTGAIQRQGSGYISCLFSEGCEKLRLEGIRFFCNSTKHQNTSIKIQGSTLSIFNSSFVRCVSSEDGGVIQSYDRSTVMVNMSNFSGSRSDRFGGAIAAYGGSVHVADSIFSDTFAALGGGAVWSSAYKSCYGVLYYYDTVLQVEGSAFTNCTTNGDGGAILVISDVSESNLKSERLVVVIKSSNFTFCLSSGYGGAIYFSGHSVIADVFLIICSYNSAYSGGAIAARYGVSVAFHGSEIHSNTASESGGAIAASDWGSLALHGSEVHDNTASEIGGAISAIHSAVVLIDCKLDNNRALGFGGGAMFLKETSISVHNSKCSGNRAPSGGGGVLFSQGSVPPAPEIISNICKQENYAVYGSCAASECKSFKFLYTLPEKAWAGLPFKLAVAKIDAYQQTILTDNSFIQLLPSTSDLNALQDLNSSFSFVGSSVSQCVQGVVSFEVAIMPTFVKFSADEGIASVQAQPNIFVQSADSLTGAVMKSDIVSIKFAEGGNVCPQGYILYLDSKKAGVCRACQPETYSVSPLTSHQGSCLNCPAGALCPDGSCVFHGNLSNRICPGAYRILGDWVLGNSSRQFTLRACPPGYSVSAQQCDLCPAFFYCTGDNVPSRPCPSNSYTPPGARSSASCMPSVFVTVTINVPIKRPDFKDNRILEFQSNLANLTRWDLQYVAIKLLQSGDDPETTTVTSDIVAPNAKMAAALVETLNSRALVALLGSESGHEHEVSLISVQVTQCIAGYELNSISKTCQLCPANYFCVGGNQGREACPANLGFSPLGSNQTASCTSAVFVTLVFSIPIFPENVTDIFKSKLIAAISVAAGISSERIEISSALVRATRSLRTEGPASVCMTAQLAAEDIEIARRTGDLISMHITANLAAENIAAAAAIKTKISQPNLNAQLLAVGLPQGTLISISMPESSANPDQTPSVPTVIGISVAAIVLLVVLSFGSFWLISKIRKQNEHSELVAVISSSTVGAAASVKHLPDHLHETYAPDIILGKCVRGNGCVVQAKPKDPDQTMQTHHNSLVAIKVVVPLQKAFTEKELDQLRRQGRVLTLLSGKRCEYSAGFFHGSGQSVHISLNLCWYVMDLLKGENMSSLIHPGHEYGAARTYIHGQSGQGTHPVDAIDCIHAARDVLAALKVVHGEGMLHLNIEPSNIIRCKADGESEKENFTYKLIGYGTVQDSDDTAAKEAVTSSAGTNSIGAGMQAYMSPEMFSDAGNAMYPTDLWSLGITMFEMVTGTLPFYPGSDQTWADAIAGSMTETAPSVLCRIGPDRSSEFDGSLGTVIATALEKKPSARYASSDDMHGAVFGCLVMLGKAFFSVYLSYRKESDGPLAKLLIDELNHSKTPGGHRVAVYVDSCGGHAQGADWNADTAQGLLHAICFSPILSFGATAPMAQFADETSHQRIVAGWQETPLGLTRLVGSEKDREDALLKEMLVAGVLLARSSESGPLLDGESGLLCAAVPVFAGRQLPAGHPKYPRMGKYFDVQGGGGNFPTTPSPRTSQAASSFLRDRVGVPVEMIKRIEGLSVASVVTSLANLPGCHLSDQQGDLVEAVLTHEQKVLVGKGYTGPPVNFDDNILSPEQVACPSLVTHL